MPYTACHSYRATLEREEKRGHFVRSFVRSGRCFGLFFLARSHMHRSTTTTYVYIRTNNLLFLADIAQTKRNISEILANVILIAGDCNELRMKPKFHAAFHRFCREFLNLTWSKGRGSFLAGTFAERAFLKQTNEYETSQFESDTEPFLKSTRVVWLSMENLDFSLNKKKLLVLMLMKGMYVGL